MVVVRREVYRREPTRAETIGPFGAAQQFLYGEVPALGLNDVAVFHGADLADGAVAGTGQRAGVLRELAHIGFERPGKEGIETIEAALRGSTFVEANRIQAAERTDQRPAQPAAVGRRVGEPGQSVLRQQMLRPDFQAGHRLSLWRGSAQTGPRQSHRRRLRAGTVRSFAPPDRR